jgi:hypothetical protein
MITTKSAKKQIITMKKAVVDQMSHISTNEKIAGAAAIGVAVGVAATALGSSLLHSNAPGKETKAMKKPTA